jgi:hypothetical protein
MTTATAHRKGHGSIEKLIGELFRAGLVRFVDGEYLLPEALCHE